MWTGRTQQKQILNYEKDIFLNKKDSFLAVCIILYFCVL